MENRKALLIIDMQNESFPPGAPCYDMEGVVNRINALSAKFRAAGLPVILVQHDGAAQGEYVPGTPGWELIPELTVSTGDIRIGKTANDTFYETELQTILDQRQVNELFITGSATDFCIDSSIQSALTKNYIRERCQRRPYHRGAITPERPKDRGTLQLGVEKFKSHQRQDRHEARGRN